MRGLPARLHSDPGPPGPGGQRALGQASIMAYSIGLRQGALACAAQAANP
ncbi:MAG: hypothetical protein HY319_22725 [Armatimonadetes bacterium]|nr:hypothetical protein [Armatimonadota bacterium]